VREQLHKSRLVRQLAGRRTDARHELTRRDMDGAVYVRRGIRLLGRDVHEQNIALRGELCGEVGGFEDLVQRVVQREMPQLRSRRG